MEKGKESEGAQEYEEAKAEEAEEEAEEKEQRGIQREQPSMRGHGSQNCTLR